MGFLAASLAVPDPASGHTRSYSYSNWELGAEPPRVTVRLRQYELTRMHLHPDYSPDYDVAVAAWLSAGFHVRLGGQPCQLVDLKAHGAGKGWVAVGGIVDCPTAEAAEAGPLTLRSDLLLDQVSSHLHFVTVRDDSGDVYEKVLSENSRSCTIASGLTHDAASDSGSSQVRSRDSWLSNLATYGLLGIEHILGGPDHLAFVVGLLLLATTLGQLGWLITGFTIAHSATLALAALGRVDPIESAVETLIGLSILLVAVEIVWEREERPPAIPWLAVAALMAVAAMGPPGIPAAALVGLALFVACYFRLLVASPNPSRWRLLIAFAFGLFHGFGFAGVLAELALPSSRLLPALLGFNLGVEVGQLAVVALLWPLLVWARRRFPVEEVATAGVAAAGTYWSVLRTLG